MRASILGKLLGGYGLIVVLMTAIGLFAVAQSGTDRNHLDELTQRVVPVTRTVGEIGSLINRYRDGQLDYIVAAPGGRGLVVAGAGAGALAADLAAVRRQLALAGRLISTPADGELLAQFRISFGRYVALTARFRALADAGRGRAAVAVIDGGAGGREYQRLNALLSGWSDRIVAYAHAASASSYASFDLGRRLLICLLTAAIAASIGVAIILSRRMTRAVHRVGAAATAIAGGDIAGHVEIGAHDELGEMAADVNLMIDYLTGIAGVAETIAGGDLSVVVTPRSDRDTLGRSLAAMTHSLRELMTEKERLIGQIPGVVAIIDIGRDGSRQFVFVSRQSSALLGLEPAAFLDDPDLFIDGVHEDDRELVRGAIREPAAAGHNPLAAEFRFIRPDGEEVWLREEAVLVSGDADSHRVQVTLFDMTATKRAELERERLELDLRLAQKLEAVGQLAAGIAHEINTPIQFIGDSVTFLKEAADELLSLTGVYRELLHTDTPIRKQERRRRMLEAERESDLDYLTERVPPAFERALAGIDRVSTIVRAMRQFAHPSASRSPTDINEALRTTLIVATNEYKYVADVELDLEELPPVMANAGDLNQVFLNLIVNAAHAIDAAGQESTGPRGTITVRTRTGDEGVVISVSDTGCGIAPEIAARVFDPFFTTKAVGRGTGQGLAIAHTIVVERHHGLINFEPNPGGGTTFRITLPIDDPRAGAELAAAA
ncbi:MAG: ATP-binding protein [Solirubrobacteraceae bacterium]|jgi:PAS domain S-box-containing protein